jgi:hypothetical protein
MIYSGLISSDPRAAAAAAGASCALPMPRAMERRG